jgi:ubiquinone/menaquinone biosynthesis C-methylase UbiE
MTLTRSFPKRNLDIRSGSVSFDRIAAEYDQSRSVPQDLLDGLAEALKTHLDIRASSRLLDIGIGTGRLAGPLQKQLGTYTAGVDLSLSMLGIARRFPALNLIFGDAQSLPVKSSSFDFTMSVHVLHLISGWRTVVSEIHRALREDGLMIFADVHVEHDFLRLRSTYNDIITARLGQKKRLGTENTDEIEAFARSVGFQRLPSSVRVTVKTRVPLLRSYNSIRDRCFSSSWDVPDHIHSEAMQILDKKIADEGISMSSEAEVDANANAELFRKTRK